MARVTVEDCLENVENRFKLVLLASKRARQLALGTEPLVEWENDKPTVVALREIAENLVNDEMMRESLMSQQVEEEKELAEDDLAAALHAEISRELNQTSSEPPVTAEPMKQSSEPSTIPSEPAPSNSIFGSNLNSATESSFSNPAKPAPQEAPSVEDPSASPIPPKPSSEEGEQGF